MTELETLLLNGLQTLEAESRARETLLLGQLNALGEQLARSAAQTSTWAAHSENLSSQLTRLASQLKASEQRTDALTRQVDYLTNLLAGLGIAPQGNPVRQKR